MAKVDKVFPLEANFWGKFETLLILPHPGTRL